MNFRPYTKRALTWFVPFALIVAGVAYLLSSQQVLATTPLIVPAPQQRGADKQANIVPASMSILAVDIQLSIKPGSYNPTTRSWSIDSSDAFFAISTATPMLYGHNTSEVFEPLRRLSKNDELVLRYKDNSSKTYRYYGTRFVSPDDTSILTEEDPHTVILLTCEGIFSNLRRIVYFKE
jgi:LPXTG-site transpeptidase (sortase) family protein